MCNWYLHVHNCFFSIVDCENDVPQICKKYQNTDCWNGSATVPVNNVEFDSISISGQCKYWMR